MVSFQSNLVRAATTTSSLEAEQDIGNINKTQSKATLNESSSQRTNLGSGPRCQEAIGDTTAQTRRIDDIDADEDITLVNVQDDIEMFDAEKDLGGKEVFVEQEVIADKEEIDEVTLAKSLIELKASKPKAKGVVILEPSESTTTTTIPKQKSQDKGKGIMVEEHVKSKKKNQIMLDEEATKRLQAEFDEEEKLIKTDYQLTERLQAQKQEELSDSEKAILFLQLLEKKRKHFAAKRAKEKRNKPPTQIQKKKITCNYLKNMEGYTLKQLNLKEFDEIQEMFDKAFRRDRRIDDIDADEDITLVNVQDDIEMFDAKKDLGGKEVFVEQEVVADKEEIDEVTLAKALIELKASKPKAKGVVILEPSESTTTTTIPKQKSQDKGKGIIVEEHVKSKKKNQIMLDEEATKRLQAEFDEEEKLVRERELKKNKKPILI
nr:hypothetical protein [Tanacetum cinerariifolium]